MKSENVEYKEGSTVCEGFAAYDEAAKKPGVLIVPEWNGVSDYSKKRAQMLADLGYSAFVADIYGKGVRPSTMEACAAEAGKYRDNRPLLRARVRAALDTLRKLPGTDAGKIAAIGYCFGGMTVLELARDGADIQGVVSFHGALNTPNPADAKNIKAKVLALHGADDPLVPPPEVAAFEQEMRDAKVDWQLVAYGNAVHSFTNFTIPEGTPGPVSYNKKADQRSWVAMQDFFKEVLH
ncbi:MAG TPA: dienelactone hydrolase family protein [Xanthobacteraceae bacterium]|nr:dienelactone hydrolase family protein [Xanthobacteraceae bacterium]